VRRVVDLSAREYTLLEYLAHHAGQALTRAQLEAAVWSESENGSNVVEVYIGYLRHKVDAPFETRLIHTVRGVPHRARGRLRPTRVRTPLDVYNGRPWRQGVMVVLSSRWRGYPSLLRVLSGTHLRLDRIRVSASGERIT